MKYRAPWYPWLVAGLAALVLAGASHAEEPRPPSVLAGVKALDKPVSFSETRIPLGELVQKVAAETGAPLTAAPAVADEPVAVAVHALPARELLEQLADLLDYQWARHSPHSTPQRPNVSTPTYEVWQDLAARNREEAAREAARAAVEQRLADQVRRFAAVAALPPQQVQELAAEHQRWNDQFFQLPPAQRSAVWQKEQSDPALRRQREQTATAHQLRSSVNRTLALLLGRLTPAEWAALRQGQPLILSTDPQPGERLLPEETARAFRAARPSMDDSWRYGDTEFAEKERQKQRNMESEWSAAGGYRVVLRLDADRFQRQGSLGLHAYAAPLQPAAGPSSAYAQAEGTSLQLYAAPGDWHASPEADAAERRAALAKDPLLGAVRRFKRQPKPRPDPDAPRNQNFTSLPDLVPDLAWSCDLNVIADSYTADRSGFPVPAEEPAPLYELLDRITQYGYQWDRKGGYPRSGCIIRIRNRAWAFLRPRDVPVRVIRHWNELLAGGGEPPLDEYAATAAALNDDQLELLPGLVRGRDTFFLHEISFARHGLRLYASFAPLQQQTLRQGQPFPVGAMSPAQRDLFTALWRERQQQSARDEPTTGPPAPPLPPLGPASRFAMTAERLIMVAEKRGEVTHFTWEHVPDAAQPSTPSAPTPQHPQSTRPANITRRALTQVRFQFIYSPEQQDAVQLNVGALTGREDSRPRS
jgi:hypothetical protein